jgi:hypothetical protein
MALYLYSSDNQDNVNANLLSLTAPAALADQMTWTAPDEPLTGNTLYFIVMGLTATQKTTRWRYGTAPEGCPLPPPWGSSLDGGGTWLATQDGTEYLMDIN